MAAAYLHDIGSDGSAVIDELAQSVRVRSHLVGGPAINERAIAAQEEHHVVVGHERVQQLVVHVFLQMHQPRV